MDRNLDWIPFLTEGERKLLYYIVVDGASIKEAAHCLGITYQTTRNRMNGIYRKLGMGKGRGENKKMLLIRRFWLGPEEML